jgi:hypothetical protein
MSHVFLTPSWFFSYSIILEFFFVLITLTVSYYAYKIYRLSGQSHTKIFSFAFVFIALSYIVWSITNLLILYALDAKVSYVMKLQNVFLINLFGSYLHAFFFIIGLILLTYLTLKVRNIKILSLLTAIVLISVFFSQNKLFLFYVLSSVLLIHIVIYYFANYIKHRNTNTLLVLLAMILLLFSSLHFVFAISDSTYYVLGHITEFLAYVLILINLLVIIKHGKKTRQVTNNS